MMRMDKLSDLESETHRMAKIQKILDDIVTRDTGLTQEILDSYRGRDFWLGYDEAMELGVIKDEPTEEELKQQLLGGEEKETMTESEFNEFITELKGYVNIIPDEPTEETEQEELDEMYCIEKAICKEYEGTNKCCYFCSKYEECDMSCNFALEISEEFSCEYLTDEPVEEVKQEVSKDMKFDDCEFAKEK